MGGIHPRQQRRIFGRSLGGGELAPHRRLWPGSSALSIHWPIRRVILRLAATGHFGQESSHYAPLLAAHCRVPLLPHYPDQQAGVQERSCPRSRNAPSGCFQPKAIWSNVISSVSRILMVIHPESRTDFRSLPQGSSRIVGTQTPRSGSRCIENEPPLQAHLVLDNSRHCQPIEPKSSTVFISVCCCA